MSHWTLVPMRGLAAGKMRLAGLLAPAERRALNTRLLTRGLDAVAGCEGSLARCIVASADADTLALAAERGATPILEAAATGLNAALEAARAQARARGARSLLVLAADLPDVSAAALAQLRAAGAAGAAVVIADKLGIGTNGLLVPASAAMPFSFGEGSLVRHRSALEAEGLPAAVWRDPRLSFDIDSPDDYRQWRQRRDHALAADDAGGTVDVA